MPATIIGHAWHRRERGRRRKWCWASASCSLTWRGVERWKSVGFDGRQWPSSFPECAAGHVPTASTANWLYCQPHANSCGGWESRLVSGASRLGQDAALCHSSHWATDAL